MVEQTAIRVLDIAGVTDATLGRPEGERVGTVLRNLLVHGHTALKLDFTGIMCITPSAASMLFHRILTVAPQALDRITFVNVSQEVQSILTECATEQIHSRGFNRQITNC